LVDREIVATRLSRLRGALGRLRKLADKPRNEYLSSDDDRALAEHYLRIALEVVLDTGNHVIASGGWRKPQSLREIPSILAESGAIPADLAERLAAAVGLRNRLVHEYAAIDHEIVHRVIGSHLADLEAFAVAIGRLCDDDDRSRAPA